MAIFNGVILWSTTFNGGILSAMVDGNSCRYEGYNYLIVESEPIEFTAFLSNDAKTYSAKLTNPDATDIKTTIKNTSVLGITSITEPQLINERGMIDIYSIGADIERAHSIQSFEINVETGNAKTIDSLEFINIEDDAGSLSFELAPKLLSTNLIESRFSGIYSNSEVTPTKVHGEKTEPIVNMNVNMTAGYSLRKCYKLSDLNQQLSAYSNMTISEMSLQKI